MAELIGTEGIDDSDGDGNLLQGTDGADTFTLLGGDDYIDATQGGDTYDGGSGYDQINYNDFRVNVAAINVDFGTGIVITPFGETDRFSSIEAIRGTSFDDTFLFSPFRTSETVFSGQGNDTIDGNGNELSRINYSKYLNSSTAVTVDMVNGTVTTSDNSFTDTITGVRRVVGTANNDVFIGSSANETFTGQDGIDSYNGGAGFDTVSFVNEQFRGGINGVVINMSAGTARDMFGNTEIFVGIEGITASPFDDQIIGGSAAEYFDGAAGNDTIDGGAGTDVLYFNVDSTSNQFEAGGILLTPEGVVVNLATGTVSNDGLGGTDTISNIENVYATQYADQLTGDANDNKFKPYAGNDTIDGGDGTDTVSYEVAKADITVVDNGNGTFTVTAQGTDTLTNVELIEATDGFIRLDGQSDSAGISINLEPGSTTVTGSDGVDTVNLSSQSRADVSVTISNGSVVIQSDAGADTLTGIERLSLSDGTLAFDVGAGENAGSVYRVYQAAFARTPDNSGLSFWLNNADNGVSMQVIAQGFINSDEFSSVYGTDVSNEEFVDRLYNNILGRAGEESGTNFWVGKLNNGASKVDVLLGFSESNENITGVASTIADGIFISV